MAFFLKRQNKSLLPNESVDREALTHSILNIKPRFSLRVIEGLKRLKNIVFKSIIVIVLAFVILVSVTPVYAQSEERHEIIAESFPEPLSLPHSGYLSSKFSSYHPGIDIAVAYGTAIHPISAGFVEQAISDKTGYGNHVIVNHGNGYKSMYAHMNKVYVKVGQQVGRVDTLGTVGMSGRTSGPHTHLEIYYNDKPTDPLALLPSVDPFPTNSGFLKPIGGGIKVNQ